MLDEIAGSEILDGVRGAQAADRAALASTIEAVSHLVSDFPEISELDLNPVFASDSGAIAVDARILIGEETQAPRYRPTQKEIITAMNRIMRPSAVAVIGASAEDGKIGNSVMKNILDGGYAGDLYPIHPKAEEILGKKVHSSVVDVPGDIDIAVL